MSEKPRKDGIPLEQRSRGGMLVRVNIPLSGILGREEQDPISLDEMQSILDDVRKDAIPVKECHGGDEE